MEQPMSIAEILAQRTGRTVTELSKKSTSDLSSFFQQRAENYNERIGDLIGYDCKLCKNRGDFMIYEKESDSTYIKPCKCMEMRKRKLLIKASGLEEKLRLFTLNSFVDKEEWQKGIKRDAQAFLSNYHGNWFFIGGQVGCGKTHICTAIVGELIKKGLPARYMLWRDEVVKIKQVVNNAEEYELRTRDLKEVKVLYIDDFLKVKQGEKPSAADMNVAFEILNFRYNNSELITIISSEIDVDAIIELDAATGSRIYEKAKQYTIRIKADKNKNQRMKDDLPNKKDEEYWWQK